MSYMIKMNHCNSTYKSKTIALNLLDLSLNLSLSVYFCFYVFAFLDPYILNTSSFTFPVHILKILQFLIKKKLSPQSSTAYTTLLRKSFLSRCFYSKFITLKKIISCR